MKRALLALLASGSLFATHEEPWVERALDPRIELSASGEWFDRLNLAGDRYSFRGRNFLLNGSLSFAPSSSLDFELECFTSTTRRKSFSIDACKETVRYMVLEDALGDPLSLSLGISAIQAWQRAVSDPSLLYPGLFSVELHTAQSKEFCLTPSLNYRLIAFEAIGFSSGSPWLRGWVGTELFSECGHLFGGKLGGIYGFGGRSLCPQDDHGFSSLKIRTLDVSLYYTFRTDFWQYYTLELLYRAYAKNAPANLLHLELKVEF